MSSTQCLARLTRLPGLLAAFALVQALLPAWAAAQQPEIAPEDVAKQVKVSADAPPPDKAEAPSPDGWKFELNLGTTGSMLKSTDVIGQDDGTTVQFGLLLNGLANLTEGQHEWQNTLKIQYAQSRTPLLGRFVKSEDNLEFKSLYLYHLQSIPWVGPYGRVRTTTSLFPGYAVQPNAITVARKDTHGNVVTEAYPPQKNIDATSAFEPLLIVESAGAFAEPVKKDELTVDGKLGAGGQHIFVRDGYTVTDDAATKDVLEMTQLEKSHSVGAELELELKGKLATNVSWGALANFFYPIVTTLDTKLTGMDRLHTDLGANLSVKLAKWLSLDYVLKAKNLPFVLDKWQIQHSLLLTAGFNLL